MAALPDGGGKIADGCMEPGSATYRPGPVVRAVVTGFEAVLVLIAIYLAREDLTQSHLDFGDVVPTGIGALVATAFLPCVAWVWTAFTRVEVSGISFRDRLRVRFIPWYEIAGFMVKEDPDGYFRPYVRLKNGTESGLGPLWVASLGGQCGDAVVERIERESLERGIPFIDSNDNLRRGDPRRS